MSSMKIKQYLGTEFSAYECMLLFGIESYSQILKEIAKLDSIELIESARSIDLTKLDKNDVYTLIHFADIAIETCVKNQKNKKPNQERQNSFDKAYVRLLKILQNNPYLCYKDNYAFAWYYKWINKNIPLYIRPCTTERELFEEHCAMYATCCDVVKFIIDDYRNITEIIKTYLKSVLPPEHYNTVCCASKHITVDSMYTCYIYRDYIIKCIPYTSTRIQNIIASAKSIMPVELRKKINNSANLLKYCNDIIVREKSWQRRIYMFPVE